MPAQNQGEQESQQQPDPMAALRGPPCNLISGDEMFEMDRRRRLANMVGSPPDRLVPWSSEDSKSWSSKLCGCFNPLSLCCLSVCCPCVAYGKTYHRLHEHRNLVGYHACNPACLIYIGALCFGIHWIPVALQRAEIRSRFNLKGGFVEDVACACCCTLCDLVQQEKEVRHQVEISSQAVPLGVQSQYRPPQPMLYPTLVSEPAEPETPRGAGNMV